jgi:hypothetical protein
MKHLMICAFLLTGLAQACGGGEGGDGSGVSGDKKIVDLDAGDLDKVCGYVSSVFPEQSITCSGQTVMIGASKAECIADFDTIDPTCAATVAQTEACADALGALSDEEFCTQEVPPAACQPLFTCEGA